MQIQQSIQNNLGLVQTVPPQVLTELVVGQQVEATVVKAALASQVAAIRLNDSIIDIRTPVTLQAGQTVQLELTQTGDKPALRLISTAAPVSASSSVSTNPAAPVLTVGQQIPVAVIQLLAENRLLVESVPSRLLNPTFSQPVRFDVDVAQLARAFRVGERAVVEVAALNPLSVNLKAAPVHKEQLVIDKIKQLLPQLAENRPQVAQLSGALKTVSLPNTVQGQIQQLVSHIIDKQAITQPLALKQAIVASGVFTEGRLLKPLPGVVANDFKANLLKLSSVIESALKSQTTSTNSVAETRNPTVSQPTTSPILSSTLGKSQVTPASSSAVTNPLSAPVAQQAVAQNITTQLKPVQTSQSSVSTPSNNPAPIKIDGGIKPTSANIVGGEVRPNTTTSTPNSSSNTSLTPAHSGPKLPLLSAIFQALGAYNATPSSISVLNTSPSAVSLPTSLPGFLDSVLTQQQAVALAQALNKSMAAEQLNLRGQIDVLVLQGLLKEVESLHARVQLNQFSMLKEPDSPTAPIASWLVDVPVKDKQGIEFIQLQIEQFSSQQEEVEIWRVQLRLDTQNLGAVQATVSLRDNDVQVVIQAEQSDSAALLEQYLPWLQEALDKVGVSVSHLSCRCGEVPEPTLAEQYLADNTHLVDVTI